MNKFFRWYNQNMIKVWFGIIVIIIAFILFFKLRNMSTNNSTSNSNISNINNGNYNSISLSSNQSAITGKSKKIDENEMGVIDKFISFCNSGNVQEAYNLISNECKEQMYKELNDFIEAYYKPVFANGKRTVNIENWYNNIYLVNLNEDALATGSFSEENSLRDYFTIVKDKEGNVKLNINGYIGRTEYNKIHTENNLEIKVLRKDTYMDYEVYTFNVKNNSEFMSELGRIQDTENISYLLDDSNFRYDAYVHEIPQSMLDIIGKQEKIIQIKYFNEFNSNIQIKKVVFPKVYLDYSSNNYSEIAFDL